MPDTPPNVLLLHCHDLGQYLGCYGHDVESPHIDALAADGERFEEFYCTAPQCSPSRSSFTTGTYPQQNGVLGLAHLGFGLDDVPHVAGAFSEAGYESHLFGFQHEVQWDDPGRLGYDVVDTSETLAHELVPAVESFLEDRAEVDQPFFASVGFTEPHRGFDREYIDEAVYEAQREAGVEALPYLPDETGVRHDLAALQVLIRETLDAGIGLIEATLQESGLSEKTIVVFTTDHGIAMPRAKGMCYDPGLETALIVRAPGLTDPGTVHEDLLSNVDLAPTLLELAGIDAVDVGMGDVPGRSFAACLGDDPGATDVGRDRVYAQVTWHDRYNPVRAIRTPEYKYLRTFELTERVFLPTDVVDTASGRAVSGEFLTQNRPAEELYHLPSDPHETSNLLPERLPHEPRRDDAVEPDHREALASLRAELTDWMEQIGDPLCEGPVPFPGGHD